MRIHYLLLFIFVLFPFILSPNVHSFDTDAHPICKSTSSQNVHEIKTDMRVYQLKNYLTTHNSPLAEYSDLLIDRADEHNIPWTLVASIAGVESTFCQSIRPNSSNCWGWNNGKHNFSDYKEGIETVSRNLKIYYYDRGMDTPEKIGKVYAPPSQTWAMKVRHFMNQIEQYTPVMNLSAYHK